MKDNLKLTDSMKSSLKNLPDITKMNNIYVCKLRTGEYSDRTEYPLCAFFLEESAKNFAENCNSQLKEQGLYLDDCTSDDHRFELDDQTYYISYTGAVVSYYSIPLRDQ